MVKKETTYPGIFGGIQRLLRTLEANKDELPQLEPFRIKLTGLLSQVLEVNQQQVALKASKQEASKQLRRLTREGQLLSTVVLTAVKEHYGSREEKIAEFGLQPFRGRKVKLVPEEPASPDAPPVEPAAAARPDR